MILAGDIGGTKTNLAIFTLEQGKLVPRFLQSFSSKQHRALSDIVDKYLQGHKVQLVAACFGVAGPVVNGRCTATNLPWIVDGMELSAQLGLASAAVINDLEATAYGVGCLERNEIFVLNDAEAAPRGTIALVAAGTGLGEAALVWEGSRYRAIASEGGHADFAPRNDEEIQLLRYLLARFGHVSYERVLSGPGLFNIYQFLRETSGYPEPDWLKEQISSGDPSAVISKTASENKDQCCVKALHMFCSLYGAEAGNLALKLVATGGVYIGGGIGPKILAKLRDGTFMQAFVDKGRLTTLLKNTFVGVILNDQTALYGAAYYASL